MLTCALPLVPFFVSLPPPWPCVGYQGPALRSLRVRAAPLRASLAFVSVPAQVQTRHPEAVVGCVVCVYEKVAASVACTVRGVGGVLEL